MAGLTSELHLIIVSFVFLIPKVFENLRNNPFIKIDRIKAPIKNDK